MSRLRKRKKEVVFVDENHKNRVKRFKKSDKKSSPNIIIKSNYFLPLANVEKYTVMGKKAPIFKPITIINNNKVNMYYHGYRGNMFDFKVYYTFLNESKNSNFELEFARPDILRLFGSDSGATCTFNAIENSFGKLAGTLLKTELKKEDKIIDFRLYNIIDTFQYKLINNKKVYLLSFTKALHDSLAFDDFSYIEDAVMERLGKNQYAIKLYTLCAFNKNELFITKKNLIEMYQPNPNNLSQFYKDFKNRAIIPLKKAGVIIKWDKSDTHYSFNIEKHFAIKTVVSDNLQKTLSKREQIRNGLVQTEQTKPTKPKIKENTKIKHRKDIIELVDYWESLGLYKHKNRNTKIFNEGLKYLSLAIDGELYSGTAYEEFNQEFKPKIIKRAIKDFATRAFDENVYPLNKDKIRKITLAFFMLPPAIIRQKFDKPFFIDCFKNGVTLIETLNKDLEDYFINFKRAYVRYTNSKLSEISKSEEAMLVKAFNNLIKGGFDYQYSFMGDQADRYLAVFKGIEHKWDKKATLKSFMLKNPEYIVGWYKNYKRENNLVF